MYSSTTRGPITHIAKGSTYAPVKLARYEISPVINPCHIVVRVSPSSFLVPLEIPPLARFYARALRLKAD